MTTVVNFFAGPGCGKSTSGLGLSFYLKLLKQTVEYIPEVAKDETYEGNHFALTNQLTILGQQFERMYRVKGKVDYMVCDSPLMLGTLYAADLFDSNWFFNTCVHSFSSFDNLNFLLTRTKEYVQVGRNQDEKGARGLDRMTKDMLDVWQIPYIEINGDEYAPANALYHLRQRKLLASGLTPVIQWI